MTDDLKIYTPQETQDAPFPQQQETKDSVSQSDKNDVYSPQTTQDNPLPIKRVAQELLSQALNTRARKILQPFQFTKSGAIQIGEYTPGEHGEIKISPSGIVALDSLGNESFILDGETGDAFFRGTVRASKFLNDYFQVDEYGNVIANSIQLISSLNVSAGAGLNQLITSTSDTDITNASISFSLERSTLILITYYWNGWVAKNTATAPWGSTGNVRINIDGSVFGNSYLSAEEISAGWQGDLHLTNAGAHYLASLDKGNHTIKLVANRSALNGGEALNIYNYRMSLITLGNA